MILNSGGVAQLGERCVRNAEVGSSILLLSTTVEGSAGLQVVKDVIDLAHRPGFDSDGWQAACRRKLHEGLQLVQCPTSEPPMVSLRADIRAKGISRLSPIKRPRQTGLSPCSVMRCMTRRKPL
jgi:hypothetical protein